MLPVTAANPWAWAASATAIEVAPPPTVATRPSTLTCRIRVRSTTSSPWRARPAQSCPPPPDRQRQAARPGGSDGALNVAGALPKDDHGRAAGDGGIPDMPCLVVGWAGREHLGGIQLRGEHLDGLCDVGVLLMRHRSLPPGRG